MKTRLIAVALLCGLAFATTVAQAADPLPSWNDGKTKQSILDFVAKVTREGSPEFVPPPNASPRSTTTARSGPSSPCISNCSSRSTASKCSHRSIPSGRTRNPLPRCSRATCTPRWLVANGRLWRSSWLSHANMTTEEFEHIVREWSATAKHPTTKRPYIEMIYQPMLELLAYLRANGFKTFIVSGGGVEFMRTFAEKVYGIPPEQVVGSSGKLQFEMRDGKPVLIKLPALDFFDDKDAKPIAIHKYIGRRPIAAFGNSDGDLQMLQWTAAGSGARFCLFVRHTDAEREWAYELTPIGRLEKGLEEANAKGWTVVDMKQDWKVIFPPEKK